MDWPSIEPIGAERLRLEPLSAEHAVQMVEVLADPALYDFTGGEPPTLEELRKRYSAQAVGRSRDGSQWWLNWIATLGDSRPIGYVQATVVRRDELLEAEIAWVVAAAHQGRGFATEAAAAMAGWLRKAGVDRLVAHINPTHAASAGVAWRLGLRPTDAVEDGEVRWELTV